MRALRLTPQDRCRVMGCNSRAMLEKQNYSHLSLAGPAHTLLFILSSALLHSGHPEPTHTSLQKYMQKWHSDIYAGVSNVLIV